MSMLSRCHLWLAVVCVLAGMASPAGADVDMAWGPHPRAAYTSEELAAWRADPSRQGTFKAAIQKGERELATPIEVPEKGGQWIFYYRCPKDNGGLEALSLDKHRCRICGRVYEDEQTVAAYRCVLHGRANARCFDLALAYALTGDNRFAVPVRAALLRYAELYPTYERHDRWGRTGVLAVVGGRRYCQHLSEGIGIMSSARAYDLIHSAPCLTDADRERIEEGFLLATAREIRAFNTFNSGKNNHQTWFNATYAVVGLVCGDAELLDAAVNGRKGYYAQMKGSLTADGIWYEGTVAYHFYALQAMETIVDAAARVGWDLVTTSRIKQMFTGPMQLAYPNGQFPAMNDGDHASLGNYRSHYAWALKTLGDPVFGPMAEGTAPVSGLGSVVLGTTGLCVLRQGGGERAVCAMLDFGEHGGHHGHPDKLNIVLYALGRELVLDPGRLTYSVPEHETWTRQTVAHNTVVVDESSQRAKEGQLLFFEQGDGFASCLADGGESYAGVDQRRFLLLTTNLLIDAFALSSRRTVTADWVLHAVGDLSVSVGTEEVAAPFGGENGYQHLSGLRRVPEAAHVVADWEQRDGRVLRVHYPDEGGACIWVGNGIGYSLKDRIPFVLRRRSGKQVGYAAVYDLTGTGDFVQSVTRVPIRFGKRDAQPWEAVGFRIKTPHGVVLVGANFRSEPGSSAPTLDGKLLRTVCFEESP